MSSGRELRLKLLLPGCALEIPDGALIGIRGIIVGPGASLQSKSLLYPHLHIR